jgi:hypothetical protein
MRAVVRGDLATRFTSGTRTLFDKPCLWCGNLFRPDRGRIKFCSVRCSQEKTKAAYRKPPPIIFEYECERCGSDFEDVRSDRRFCSRKCAQPIQAPLRCKECGIAFIPKRRGAGRRVFCTPECGRRAHKRAWKAKAKAMFRANKHKTFDPLSVFERDGWACKAMPYPYPCTSTGDTGPKGTRTRSHHRPRTRWCTHT